MLLVLPMLQIHKATIHFHVTSWLNNISACKFIFDHHFITEVFIFLSTCLKCSFDLPTSHSCCHFANDIMFSAVDPVTYFHRKGESETERKGWSEVVV